MQKETDEVINQLLDIDMHQEENENDEYDVPLAPDQVHVQPSGTVPKTDNVEQATTPDAEGVNIKPLLLSAGYCDKNWNPSQQQKAHPEKESVQNCGIQTQEEIFKTKEILLC